MYHRSKLATSVVVAVLATLLVSAAGTVSAAEVTAGGCPDVLFVGARGSGEPPQPPDDVTHDPAGHLGLGTTLWDAYMGVKLELRALRVEAVGVNYIAAPALPFGVQPSLLDSPGYFLESVRLGAQDIVRTLRARMSACGNVSDYLLAGYSQGAWALHVALAELTAAERARVSAVLMFGDPLLDPGSRAVRMSRPGGGVGAAFPLRPSQTARTYVPRDLIDRTASYCLPKDPICQPRTAGPLTLVNCAQGFCAHYNYVADGVTERGVRFASRLARPLSRQVTIAITSLPDAVVGTDYTATLTARRGREPYRWSILDGGPQWLRLNSATGVLTGTPPAPGQFTLRFRVADGRGTVGSANLVLHVRTSTPTSRWTQDGYDASRAGVNPSESTLTSANVSAARPAWQYTEPVGSSLSRPVVSGDTAFLVSHTLDSQSSRVVALNEATGAVRWRRTLDGSAFLPPVVSGAAVFVQTSAGLSAYAIRDGAPLWSVPELAATTCRAGTIAVEDGTLYAFTGRAVSAIHVETGAIRWTTAQAVYCFTGIAVANGRVYVVSRSVPQSSGSQQGEMRALNTQTGAIVWTRTTEVTMDGTPVAANGLVYAGTQYETQGLLAFDASNGAIRWQRRDLVGTSAPAVTANHLITTSDDRTGATPSVRSLSPLTGATIWTTTIPGTVTDADPVVANGVVYIGSRGNPKAVQALRLDNGTPLAALRVGTGAGNSDISPVVINGAVFAAVTPDQGFGTPIVPTLQAFRLP